MTAAAMRAKRTPPAPVVATKITLEDHGQDFLEWDLDAEGRVVGCRPFQASIWGGVRVTNHCTLRVGHRPVYVTADGTVRTLKYPAESVMRMGAPASRSRT